MNVKKNEAQAMRLPVTSGLFVTVTPNQEHEFLMSTQDVAVGYGISTSTIRDHRNRNKLELIEGKHFVRGVENTDTLPQAVSQKIYWTKRGIVRLGFFIRSERARMFRDWAEDLVVSTASQPATPVSLPAARSYRSNRLTPDRVVDILSDVCLIEDKELRERIANKITGGLCYGN